MNALSALFGKKNSNVIKISDLVTNNQANNEKYAGQNYKICDPAKNVDPVCPHSMVYNLIEIQYNTKISKDVGLKMRGLHITDDEFNDNYVYYPLDSPVVLVKQPGSDNSKGGKRVSKRRTKRTHSKRNKSRSKRTR